MPLSSIPAVIDDATLLRMVETPRRKLFPSLNRASAFAPLILVCCAVPGLLLLANPALNEESALWGLRSLAVASAPNAFAVLIPGTGEAGEPLIFQPPLAAWFNGAVIRVLGSSSPLSMALVSLVATGIAIWLATRCAWRIGGANTALIAALLMCSYPYVLDSAIAPTNGPIGFCLMLASVFGLQRHLEGKHPEFSSSLLISGITWGLALLAVGPIALSVPVIFVVHSLNPFSRPQPDPVTGIVRRQYAESRLGQRSVAIFIGIGLLVGGWWEVMMFVRSGIPFWQSWWTSLTVECLSQGNSEWRCDLSSHVGPNWRNWLSQSAMLLGWIIVGLERSWYECRRSTDERRRQRYQLILLWWGITFCGRAWAEVSGHSTLTNTAVWNVALVTPTILLASLGIGSLIERSVSRATEFFLIVLMFSLTVSRVTSSWQAGIVCVVVTSALLAWGPRMMRSTGGNYVGWTESGWRQLLQFTVYGSLVACLSAGLGLRSPISPDEYRLDDLKTRLAVLPEVRRISLISSRDPIPVALRYVMRCRWPHAELVATEGWDFGLTEAMTAEKGAPRSHFLLLEWTRRDIRLNSDSLQLWQITAVGDPMRFQGRRLSVVLIGPRS